MALSDKKEKLDYLLKLIETENAGTAKELSKRICVSPRTVERLISELRNEGYHIDFCAQRESYYLIDNDVFISEDKIVKKE